MSSPSNQQFAVIGPDFVDETKKTWRPQLQFEKTSLVYFLSPVPLEIDGLHVIAAYDRKSRLSGFIHYSNPKPALSDRLLSSGYTTSENLPNQVGPGWISLGSKLSQMEKHKIYEGSAWYTGEVELSKKQASRSDLRLFIEFASDFVKIFVNGHYLRTVFPLGTEIDNRAGGSYRFKIPSRFLRPGKNILHFHVTIWGHGMPSFSLELLFKSRTLTLIALFHRCILLA
ncbi:hypothetical protein BKA69DRAFT_1061899 [Paraphysoderma sedebokerense]|nr:hypothetical protein BKA69DRAFT_1061899 [Paraphysoderma sedebokerense]